MLQHQQTPYYKQSETVLPTIVRPALRVNRSNFGLTFSSTSTATYSIFLAFPHLRIVPLTLKPHVLLPTVCKWREDWSKNRMFMPILVQFLSKVIQVSSSIIILHRKIRWYHAITHSYGLNGMCPDGIFMDFSWCKKLHSKTPMQLQGLEFFEVKII